ncbi:Oligosaccharide translocation protein rft1 [Podila humilis]|nr:Oligosaccharide translocation protein rft1 [Podila humilis]
MAQSTFTQRRPPHAHDPFHVADTDSHHYPQKELSSPLQPQQQQAVNNDDASNILSSSVQGASYLVLLQFVSRMLTFSLNQILLRFTSAETLGIASVQLELLLNTILFLSREGVRCAAIRVSDDISDNEGSSSNNNSDNNNNATTTTTTNNTNKTNTKSSESYRLQKLVNMVYAPIPVGAFMTCLAVGYYLSQLDPNSEDRFPGYRLSIYLYGVSALIELLAEPMFMVAQYKLWFKSRVSVEGTAVIVRCVLTCALTIYGAQSSGNKNNSGNNNNNTMGVLAFAIAQFVYGLLTLGGFLLAFWNRSEEKKKRVGHAKKTDDGKEDKDGQAMETISIKALIPRRLTRTGKDGQQEHFFFDNELLKLSRTLTAQSLLKHILTEGDKMMMAGFTSEADQGVYAFVVNYGSLIARILFQPMEEISRTLFSKLLSDIGPPISNSTSSSLSSSTSTLSTTPSTVTSTRALSPTQLSNLVMSQNLLLTIMKFHVLLGAVFIAFGTHYTATLIDLIVGRYWSRATIAPAVLSLYCYYVPIMGLNGITEAVVQAVASERELAVLSYWMVGFSAVFCTTAAVLMGAIGLGAQGIVLANCVNLSMRILWSTWFLSKYYGRYLNRDCSGIVTTDPASSTSSSSSSSSSSSAQQGVLQTFSNVPWRTVLPSSRVVAAFVGAYAVTEASERITGWDGLYDKALHLAVGVLTFAVTMMAVFVYEKPFIRDIQNAVRQRRR